MSEKLDLKQLEANTKRLAKAVADAGVTLKEAISNLSEAFKAIKGNSSATIHKPNSNE